MALAHPSGFGQVLRHAREVRGLSPEVLARQLNLSLAHLQALEASDWESLPPGRERPLARQVAERLGLDPDDHPKAWAELPGELAEDPTDPKRERMEHLVMAGLALGTVAMGFWLLVPGPSLKSRGHAAAIAEPRGTQLPMIPPRSTQAYPVLGEALPQAPVTEEGVLVILRSLDTCTARIQGEGVDKTQTLQVSVPWTLRVQGDFSITLDNAGVVSVEVAGRPIRHGQSVGEGWTGRFSGGGAWIQPAAPEEVPATRPDTDPEGED